MIFFVIAALVGVGVLVYAVMLLRQGGPTTSREERLLTELRSIGAHVADTAEFGVYTVTYADRTFQLTLVDDDGDRKVKLLADLYNLDGEMIAIMPGGVLGGAIGGLTSLAGMKRVSTGFRDFDNAAVVSATSEVFARKVLHDPALLNHIRKVKNRAIDLDKDGTLRFYPNINDESRLTSESWYEILNAYTGLMKAIES